MLVCNSPRFVLYPYVSCKRQVGQMPCRSVCKKSETRFHFSVYQLAAFRFEPLMKRCWFIGVDIEWKQTAFVFLGYAEEFICGWHFVFSFRTIDDIHHNLRILQLYNKDYLCYTLVRYIFCKDSLQELFLLAYEMLYQNQTSSSLFLLSVVVSYPASSRRSNAFLRLSSIDVI